MSDDTPKASNTSRSNTPPRLKLVTSSDVADDEYSDRDDDAGSQKAESEFYDSADSSNVAAFPSTTHVDKVRIIEALLFAAPDPITTEALACHLPVEEDVEVLLAELQNAYAHRGVNLVKVAGKWTFRTAQDLGYLLQSHAVETRRLSKAALETLAIIGYHQPVTRAEIEDVRGVTTSAGTLDILLETGWVRLRGRRRAPGRPVTYGTTDAFLSHFGLENIKDLPGLSELKGAGLLDSALPDNFKMPEPTDIAALMPDELPLDDDEEETGELPFNQFEDELDPDLSGDEMSDMDNSSDTEQGVDEATVDGSVEDPRTGSR